MNTETEVVSEPVPPNGTNRIQRVSYVSALLLIFLFLPLMLSTVLFKLGAQTVDIFAVIKNYNSGFSASGYKTNFDLLAFWYVQIPVYAYYSVKRVRDIGWNSWLTVILALPVLNLVLCGWPGSKESNVHGSIPKASAFSTKLFVFTAPITVFMVLTVASSIVR